MEAEVVMSDNSESSQILICEKCGARYQALTEAVKSRKCCGVQLKPQQQEIVTGKATCVACGAEQDGVRAPIRTAWIECNQCGEFTAMFIYRGKSKDAKQGDAADAE